MWLSQRNSAAPAIRRSARTRFTKKEMIKATTKEWNRSEVLDGVGSRRLPKVKWKVPPAVWEAELKGEERRQLLKWYIGRFPIPRRGVCVPQDANRELALIMRKDTSWEEGEVEKVRAALRILRSCTASTIAGIRVAYRNQDST